jgi:hypothetical protein
MGSLRQSPPPSNAGLTTTAQTLQLASRSLKGSGGVPAPEGAAWLRLVTQFEGSDVSGVWAVGYGGSWPFISVTAVGYLSRRWFISVTAVGYGGSWPFISVTSLEETSKDSSGGCIVGCGKWMLLIVMSVSKASRVSSRAIGMRQASEKVGRSSTSLTGSSKYCRENLILEGSFSRQRQE